VIFLLTTAINGAVMVLAGVGVWIGLGSDKTGLVYGLVPAAVVLAGLAFFLLLPRGLARHAPGRRAKQLLGQIGDWVKASEATAFKRDWRVLGAIGYLLFDIGVLWACLRAVGTTPPLLAVVIGYQIGYLANLVPIPGGLGVLEGGLLGALLLYGLPAAPTAAAVILYHAIALWIPTLGGTIAFARLRKSVVSRGASIVAIPTGDEPETQATELAA
jgi:uncharacterized membrane protein YbhN (UPF0104 family)